MPKSKEFDMEAKIRNEEIGNMIKTGNMQCSLTLKKLWGCAVDREDSPEKQSKQIDEKRMRRRMLNRENKKRSLMQRLRDKFSGNTI